MTDPHGSLPPPPPPGGASDRPEKDPVDRRKRIAIGINVVLLLGVVTAIVLNGRDSGESPVEAEVAATATSTTAPDDPDAFVIGLDAASIPSTTTVDDEQPGGDDSAATTTTTTTTTTSSTTTTEPEGPPELSGELDEDGIPVGLEFPLYNSEHTIIGGENLWLIAANQLAAITERPLEAVPQAQIAVYWERVIETNRSSLRSGDPNLVYAGEVVKFPGA